MTFGSLFAGIGGFDLGLERAGMVCSWQVENDEFCNKVLEKHWPDVPRYGDIRDVGGAAYLAPVDLICGGFPCQPFSQAGVRGSTEDNRDLWPEMARIIGELRPAWVLGENVAGFVKMALDRTLSDLEGLGYACRAFVIPACAVSAPHERKRVWIVAHATCELFDGSGEAGPPGRPQSTDCCWWELEPDVGRMVDGVSARVDRLKALGNAVVPALVEEIGRCIMETEARFHGSQ